MLTQAELVGLLAEVAKGDDAAFEQLYGATRAKLYGVLLRILGRPELADEVMQETYLKVWKMAGRFDPTVASPITWMVAIARNRAIDIVRKRGELSIEEEPEAIERRGGHAAAAGAPRDDGGAQAFVGVSRQARSGKAAHRAARLLQRLEPRSTGKEARHSREHNQDLVASQPARDPWMYGKLTEELG